MKGDQGAGSFESISSAYDAWYETPLGQLVDRLEKAAVWSLAESEPGDLALDLSCGTGNHALALAERGLSVVGVDLSESILRLAQAKAERAGVGLSVVRADGSALPFRASVFDLVTLILGLEFAADSGKTLQEARRVLKPGARIVVAILNRASLWTLWRRFKRLLVPAIWRRATFLSLNELREAVKALGFRDLQCQRAVHFLPLFWTRGVRWLERWEALGTRWMPAWATFVAVSGQRI